MMKRSTQQRIFYRIFVVTMAALVLIQRVCSTGTTSVRALELTALAEVLGIPMDEDVGPKRDKMPEFLETVYDCWRSSSGNCGMPDAASDANVVRSFLGYENPSPPKAVQSYNHETELLNSLAINFNITYRMRQPEVIRYALMRIHRKALSSVEIQSLNQKCDFSHLELRVYTILDSNDKGEQVVVLKQTRDLNLTAEQLAESEWYSFYNFTDMYKADIESPVPNKQQLVMVRLSIGDSEACPGISPAHLGFTSAQGTESELIGFTKNDIQEAPLTSKIITSLSAMYRRKRDAQQQGDAGSGSIDHTDVKFDNISTNVTTSKPESRLTLEEMRSKRCRLYSHTISFADLEWEQYVIEPESYKANFCVGHCSWPLEKQDNTTKHSYIQGVANLGNPDLIPPPCCVPKDLGPLLVSLQQSPGVFEVKKWEDMVATSCSCR